MRLKRFLLEAGADFLGYTVDLWGGVLARPQIYLFVRLPLSRILRIAAATTAPTVPPWDSSLVSPARRSSGFSARKEPIMPSADADAARRSLDSLSRLAISGSFALASPSSPSDCAAKQATSTSL